MKDAAAIKESPGPGAGNLSGKGEISVGVIGYGYWGPNIARNFNSFEKAKVKMICEQDSGSLGKAAKAYPNAVMTADSKDVLSSPDIDAVAIITPVSAHYELAKQALLNGKHIFIEKPFTASVVQAEELVELADKKNLKIMVDHTFIFTGAVRKMKQLVDDGVLGDIYYYDSIRVNLGLFQHDINVIWDLAPHDFAIMDYLISEKPAAVQACGKEHVKNGREDIAFVTVHFANNIIAHFNVNWLSPVKVRLTLLGGEKKMLVWNDAVADEKIRIYDKGINVKSKEGIHDRLVSYRSGDMLAPKIEQTEALKLAAEHFVNCILSNETPVTDGKAGLRIVRMLEACDQSLKKQGGLVYL